MSSKMPAHDATELLRELQRSKWLPAYNQDGVNRVLNEIREYWLHTNKQLQVARDSMMHDDPAMHINLKAPEHQATLQTHIQAIYRNKRCLLAYLKYRCDRIHDLYWETGESVVPRAVQPLLSQVELKHFEQYAADVAQYMEATDCAIINNRKPPRIRYMFVRCIAPYGGLQTDKGTVDLTVGQEYLLQSTDAEPLIKQGYIEVVEASEVLNS